MHFFVLYETQNFQISMQLEVILVFGMIICLINPVKSGCYDDRKYCSNVKLLGKNKLRIFLRPTFY